MKAGLENKRNVAILAGLLLVMLGSIVYFVKSVFIGGGSPPPPAATAQAPAAQPAQGGTQTAVTGGHAAQKVPALASLDPTLHPELMAEAESVEYSGSGRNIFSMTSAPPKIEQVKGPVRQSAPPPQLVAQGPPPPPPIDLKFFGFAAQGSAKHAFLLHGDDVFIANEGDVVDHHYKILKINPMSIQVTDLLYNNTQTLPLVQS